MSVYTCASSSAISYQESNHTVYVHFQVILLMLWLLFYRVEGGHSFPFYTFPLRLLLSTERL